MKTVTITKYVAFDNVEFTTEAECAVYEMETKLKDLVDRNFGNDSNSDRIQAFIQLNWGELCTIVMGMTE